MKSGKLIFSLVAPICFCLALAAQAVAATGGFRDSARGADEGFYGPGPAPATVQEVKNMPDDSRVTLRGHIERSLGGDDYLFRDGSGSITVEIDKKRWAGQTVTPADLIEIQGKVDKDWSEVEIDVKHLIKLPPK